jgi:uncharacterized protein (TIGR02391 family)
MSNGLTFFERIARNAARFHEHAPSIESQHPFELRNIHSVLPPVVRELFDNGHYAQATFEAFKFLDNEVKRHTRLDRTGKALMMEAFKDASPLIQLTPLLTETDRNEQEGYRFLFAGSVLAIRNPRGHEYQIMDDVDTCLDHLSLVSHLLRRLIKAGYAPSAT